LGDLLGETLAFGGRWTPRPADDKELLEAGLVGEVTHDGADGVGVEGVALGQLLGRGVLQVVSLADLVITLSDQGRVAEQLGQLRGTSHGSWVGNRQVTDANAVEANAVSADGIEQGKCGGQAENQGSGPKRRLRGADKMLM
jgi:hypothetical protein